MKTGCLIVLALTAALVCVAQVRSPTESNFILKNFRAPLFAINSSDDLINPPELKFLERDITRVARGRAIMVPVGPETRGHQSHSVASLWEGYLKELLALSEH
jgi:hypothetical protein